MSILLSERTQREGHVSVDDQNGCWPEIAIGVLWGISLLFGSTNTGVPITSFLALNTEILVDYIEKDFCNQ